MPVEARTNASLPTELVVPFLGRHPFSSVCTFVCLAVYVPAACVLAVHVPAVRVPDVCVLAVRMPAVRFPAACVLAVYVPAVCVPAVCVLAVYVPAVRAAHVPAVRVPAVHVPAVRMPAVPACFCNNGGKDCTHTYTHTNLLFHDLL